jgi:hypothetical protein
MRHAARTDASQAEVVKALRAIGAQVYYVKLPLDLLVAYRSRTFLVEVKEDGGRMTKEQSEFLAVWTGEAHVVRSPEEAVRVAIGERAMA